MSTGYQINKTRAKAGTQFQNASHRLCFSSDIAKDAMQNGCDGLYAIVNRVPEFEVYNPNPSGHVSMTMNEAVIVKKNSDGTESIIAVFKGDQWNE